MIINLDQLITINCYNQHNENIHTLHLPAVPRINETITINGTTFTINNIIWDVYTYSGESEVHIDLYLSEVPNEHFI